MNTIFAIECKLETLTFYHTPDQNLKIQLRCHYYVLPETEATQ